MWKPASMVGYCMPPHRCTGIVHKPGKEPVMSKKVHNGNETLDRARPLVGQKGHEIQEYGKIARLPIGLDVKVCAASVDNLNQLLADTITLRDLYKKHHWQL